MRFCEKDMLKHIDLERILIARVSPPKRKALKDIKTGSISVCSPFSFIG